MIYKIFKSNIISNNNINENILQDTILDDVIQVEEINSSKDKVYDLTIEDTRNFMILGGLNVRDTFH